ncbi:MAG: hypothetical protein JEY99_14960 [Spirochaetales bacterium]|nr:hypothetical protein [Spirochaetales bacterium]
MNPNFRMNPAIFLLGILIFAIPFFTSCPGASPTGTTDPEGTENEIEAGGTNVEILRNLGMEPDTSPAKNGNGEEVSGTMNPMGGTITTLSNIYELASVGATLDGMGPYSLSEHNGQSGSGLSVVSGFSSDQAWMNYPKKSLAVDINNDGKDNVITAVFNGPGKGIYFMIQQADGSFVKTYLKDNQGTNIETIDWMENFGADTSKPAESFQLRDFTTGDFDGDYDSEFVVSCLNHVIIFDHEFKMIGTLTLPVETPYVRVEAGDLNNDHYDDLVVVNGSIRIWNTNSPGYLHILEGSSSGLDVTGEDGDITNFSELSHVMDTTQNDVQLSSAEIVIFNPNYDDDETDYMGIALAGIDSNWGSADRYWPGNFLNVSSTGTLAMKLRYIDPYNEASGNFQYVTPVPDVATGIVEYVSGRFSPRSYLIPRLVAGHFDPNRDMVNVMDLMYFINESDEWEVFDQFVNTSSSTGISGSYDKMVFDVAVAGDITGNGFDELIYSEWPNLPQEGDWNTAVMNKIVVWGVDATSNTYEILETKICNSMDEYPTLALANVDDDALVIEYLGHELNYSAPKILAVLASAPYYADLGDDMDISNSGTSYSISNSEGSGSEVDWGFHVNASIGFEIEDPTGAFGGGLNVEVTNSFDWSWGQMYTQSTTLTHTVDAGYDQVIFVGVPMDTYYYKVISSGRYVFINDPDYESDEKIITINIPREVMESCVELNAYNSMVPDECKIPEEMIKHTIGDPFSYYDEDDKAGFVAEATALSQEWMFSTATTGVFQGSGTVEISTEKTVDSISTFNYDLGIDVQATGKAGYVVAGYGAGAHVGYGYTHEVSNGIGVGGVVGSIADLGIWTENNFQWGIMMIPQSFEDQKYNLITYWIEDNT